MPTMNPDAKELLCLIPTFLALFCLWVYCSERAKGKQ